MDKRGLFVVLVLLFSLISVNYSFAWLHDDLWNEFGGWFGLDDEAVIASEYSEYTGPCPTSGLGVCGCSNSSACRGLIGGLCSSDDARECAEGHSCVDDGEWDGACASVTNWADFDPGIDISDYTNVNLGNLIFKCENNLNCPFDQVCSVDGSCMHQVCGGAFANSCPFSYSCVAGICRRPINFEGHCGSVNDGWNCFNDAEKCKFFAPGVGFAAEKTCSGDHYCRALVPGNASVDCIPKKESGQTCGNNYECLFDNCVDGVCVGEVTICDPPCGEGEVCDEGIGDCVIEEELCVSDDDCTDEVCMGGSCTEVACDSSEDCEDDEACFGDAGGSGECAPCDEDDDGDGDGLSCHDDLCEGNDDPDENCDSPNTGGSCSSVGGRTCNTRCITSIGPAAERSRISREANCWVPSSCTCEGTPIYIAALGISVRFDKQCKPRATCLSEVRVKNTNNGADVLTSDFLALGISASSNPYTEQDAACCGINLEPGDDGRSVPGYGVLALLISGLIISLYYIKKQIESF